LHGFSAFLLPLEAALQLHGPQIKLASLDHISSIPTCLIPIKELVDLCHKYSIPVLVDGAHVMGNVPLDIRALNPDFYVSSAHKWMYSPKGSGFLYVAKQYQQYVSPTVISLEYIPNSYQNNFQYTGTKKLQCSFCHKRSDTISTTNRRSRGNDLL